MSQLLHNALHLHQQGRLAEAFALYQQVLKAEPRNVDALHLLGRACQQLGHWPDAAKYLKKCLKLKPDFVQAQASLGDTMSMLGDFKSAASSFQRAIALAPGFAGAYGGLAHALLRQGRHEEALANCRRAVSLEPDTLETQNLFGLILTSLGRHSEAEGVLRRALELAPGHASILDNLGNVLATLGRNAEAEEVLRRALALAPDSVEANYNLGLVLSSLERPDEAEAAFRRTLALNSAYVSAWCGLARLECGRIRLDEAEGYGRKAVALDPRHAGAHAVLGEVLKLQGRLNEAVGSFLAAVRCDPNDFSSQSLLLFAYNLIDGVPQHTLERARLCGRLLSKHATGRRAEWKVSAAPQRLRVGFVSGDLRYHPVGYFLESVLSHLDPARVELFAYSTVPKLDDLSERLRPYFSDWKLLCGRTNLECAQMIRDDGIHLLVDLSGHTMHNALPVFAWKPAPVQASWLGYFATTGVAEIDYLLADEVGVPTANRAHFTESVWYLPDTRLCYSPPEFDVPVGVLPALTRGYFTFASFQNLHKLNDAVLSAWAQVLAAVPGSRLRLQNAQLGKAAMVDAFRARCTRLGIDTERLDIYGTLPREDYLAAHNEVDLILDTFPYPGGTTTCDALWMGVPTLTLAGETLLARQGASLLAAAGLSEWIVESEAAYVAKAITLAGDLPRLAALRAGLRAQVLASPLFDAQRFARHLETAFWGMWEARGSAALAAGSAKIG